MVVPKGEINTAGQGRKFLEKFLLLCPVGEPLTHTALSTSLHQISMIKGVPKQAHNAIRALAYMVDELEETFLNEIVRDAVNSQLGELTADMKLLVEDAKEKIDKHIQEKPSANVPTANHSQTHSRSYANALVNPPPHANPRIAAREGIKARQVMIEGIDKESKVGQMGGQQLRNELNGILNGLGLEGKNIRSAMVQRRRGILVETENDETAAWLGSRANQEALCKALGEGVSFKPRSFNIIAYNVALTIEPDNVKHLQEIGEVNHLDPDTITTLRWAKPIQRRSPSQKTAHLIVTFTSAEAANRAIADGLNICNRRVHVGKIKKEPVRCLKCQGWNHFAYECISKTDRCANCTEEHRTDQCPHPHQHKCVSCNVDGHASWSRSCPIFLRKAEECDRRNPENSLHFIPSKDPWTWTAQDQERRTYGRADTYRTNNNNEPHTYGRTDTYWPSYGPPDHPQGQDSWGRTNMDWNTPYIPVPPSRPEDIVTPEERGSPPALVYV